MTFHRTFMWHLQRYFKVEVLHSTRDVNLKVILGVQHSFVHFQLKILPVIGSTFNSWNSWILFCNRLFQKQLFVFSNILCCRSNVLSRVLTSWSVRLFLMLHRFSFSSQLYKKQRHECFSWNYHSNWSEELFLSKVLCFFFGYLKK